MRKGDDHPDVKRLEAQYEALEHRIAPGGVKNLEGRMQTLNFELQRLESMKGQASTIASTLLANSNQSIMTIARNMRLV
jgi:hypothetical protein